MMHYDVVSFAEISYSEPRARLNHLDITLAVTELGMRFKAPEKIIRRKVELLDSKMEDIDKNGRVNLQ